ncbi:YihY/virulence factor BrkB family protein [Pseudohoeflea coraliihabitans]|uniref:YihY/virulence factor BrkB family protein n=1 Tax=Pseudohoeflea coraliihabitans TaxID=2860393 RepID=A0ABS6WK71_9HYPH|nr:YihY/virulence factor BrkB family protein [Pseudohoeflea sp. DP4N28-3]MBW3096343.1 YihY/virulence factor BrkB family protein [Pseudohoeflea sp. DP4N28-3]
MAAPLDDSSPREIPPRGWKAILWEVKDAIGADRVSLVAAGVAFYGLLAIFPAITALMALAGLIVEPAQIAQQIEAAADIMPQDAAQIVIDQAKEVAGSSEGGLGLAFVIGLVLALYSASKGMGSLMQGLNIAYGETEDRGFIALLLTRLGLTAVVMIGLILGLAATLAVPAALALIPMPEWLRGTLSIGGWLIITVLTILGLGVLYRYGPSRPPRAWRWVSPGAVASTILWLLASIAFSIYVRNFGSYSETFGSLAGVVLLLMWMWISAFVILFGAELNAATEERATED